jgi:hypothetical protein
MKKQDQMEESERKRWTIDLERAAKTSSEKD